MEEILKALMNFGIAGVMVALVAFITWYQQTKQFPGMLETFSKELQEERNICEKRHAENLVLHNSMQQNIKDLSNNIRDLVGRIGVK